MRRAITRSAGGGQHRRDATDEIPLSAIPQGKPTVTVRFQATEGNDIAAVFGVRMVRR